MSWIFEPRILRMPPGDGGGGGGDNQQPMGPADLNNQQKASEEISKQQQSQSKLNEDLLIGIDRIRQETELEKQKAEIIGKQIEMAKSRIDLQSQYLSELSKELNSLEKSNLSATQIIENAEKLNTTYEKVLEQFEDGTEAQKELQTILENNKKIAQKINEIEKDANLTEEQKSKQIADQQKLLAASAKEVEKLRGNMSDVQKFSGTVSSKMGSALTAFGGAASESSTLAGNIAEFSAELNTGLQEDKMKMISKGLADFGRGALFSLIEAMKDLVVGLDSMSKKLQSANGIVGNFSTTLMESNKATIKSGASLEENQQAINQMISSYSSFNPKAKEFNAFMASNVVLLSKFGVETGTSVAIIEDLERGLKITGEEAVNMARNIVTAGRNIGISSRKLADDLKQNIDLLIQFGNRGEEVFKNLAVQAKDTGIEMNKLVSIAQGFDKFDTAASSVQKLNAFLGTNLNALDLMNADYDETIKLLRQGLQGIDLESMNRFEQEYIKTALGAQSLADVQALLSEQKVTGNEAELEKQRMTQEQLAELTEELVPILDRFKLAFMRIASALTVVLYPFLLFIEVISYLDAALDGLLVQIPLILTMIRFVGTAFGAVVGTVSAATVGAFALIMSAYMLISDFFKSLHPAVDLLMYVVDIIIVAGFYLGMFTATVNPVSLAIAGVVGILFAFRNEVMEFIDLLMGGKIAAAFGVFLTPFRKLFDLLGLRFNPFFFEIFGFMSEHIIKFSEALFILSNPFNAIATLFTYAFDKLTPFAMMLKDLALEYIPYFIEGIKSLADFAGPYVSKIADYFGFGGNVEQNVALSDVDKILEAENAMANLGEKLEGFLSNLESAMTLISGLGEKLNSDFMAVTVEGGKTTVVAGDVSIMNALKDGVMLNFKLEVPQPVVYVSVDGKDIRATVDTAKSGDSFISQAFKNVVGIG